MEVEYIEPILLEDLGMHYATEKSKKKKRYGLYRCGHCGEEFMACAYDIKNEHTRSCGCLNGNKHGLASNRFYKTWQGMIQRCTNQKDIKYKDYGGRGIEVCEEWLDVINFIKWAEATYIEGATLDRIDNDKGYSPDNCRWADKTTQVCNQRMKKSNKSGFVGISFDSKSKSNIWISRLRFNNKEIFIGSFKTKEEAVQARDNYIISNNLPHKLSIEYKKE